MIDYLNKHLLFNRYRFSTIINDKISYLVIVIKVQDNNLTISIITNTDVTKKMLSNHEKGLLNGVKVKIDVDENKSIIKVEKISFLGHKQRAN